MAELDEKTKDKIEGERIRSKQDKILYDERPTSYYYKNELIRGQTKQITILKKDNAEEIETKTDILMEIQNFYSTLYDTKIHNETQTTDNLKYVKNKINAEEAKELNKPFTEEEISKATKQMNNEKSPGEDGLTKEFYHTFLDLLSAELSELFNII